MNRIEIIILSGLITQAEFSRKVLPFIKTEYFASLEERYLFDTIHKYITTYGQLPSISALSIEIENIVDINESAFKSLKELLITVGDSTVDNKELEWLLINTEKFCQDKALYNAIMESIEIMNADKNSTTHKNLSKTSIPSVLTKALAVTFDSKVGHDYIGDSDSRYEHYHEKDEKIPFDIELLNTITNGGLPKKALSIILGGTGTGKSMVMCHFAANNLMDGNNVLYITLEMSELETAKRIDANVFDVDIKDISSMSKTEYHNHVDDIKRKTMGRLIIKEYPTASAHAGHFRFLLDELKLKEKFIPDIIYIDYINICLSMRMKMDGNSYSYIKSIAEEIRGMAVEFNVPIVSATQTNRNAQNSSDVDLTNVSESTGLSSTCDLMLAIISSEQLSELGQLQFKQLKNRYNDVNSPTRFLVGVNKSKMKLFDLETSVQNTIIQSGQSQVTKPAGGFFGTSKNKFSSINV